MIWMQAATKQWCLNLLDFILLLKMLMIIREAMIPCILLALGGNLVDGELTRSDHISSNLCL
jgi:hypothetical protein